MADAPRTTPRQLTIEIDRNSVRFIFRCADRYDAMKLYDESVLAANNGDLKITVGGMERANG